MSNQLTLLSLFSGAGGMDLGFEGNFDVLKKSINTTIHPEWGIISNNSTWVRLPKTSIHTVFANDIIPVAKRAWENYFMKTKDVNNIYQLASIVDLVKEHKKGISVFPNCDIDILTGGFPCQDFSISGKRRGFNSTKNHDGQQIDISQPSIESRGQLYIWMREVISIVKPKVFIAENVKGLVNLSDIKKIIEEDFRTINNEEYLVIEGKVLHAADYGVPQSRERVFFFGFKKSALTQSALIELSKPTINTMYDPFPQKTHSYTEQREFLLPPVTTQDYFIGLNEPHQSTDISQQHYSKAKYMGKHCQGQTEVSLSKIAPTIRSEHHGNIEFRRLSSTNGGQHIHELEKGLLERRLTVRECARIQTFPDSYEFIFNGAKRGEGVSASSAYKLIGNAVPPLLAYHIVKNLEIKWTKYFKKL